jgi:hypothetical protein
MDRGVEFQESHLLRHQSIRRREKVIIIVTKEERLRQPELLDTVYIS